MGMMTRRNIKMRRGAVVKPSSPQAVPHEPVPVVDIKYTKTDIYRLSTAELREFAKYKGIQNVDSLTGSEIKRILISQFDQ